MRRTSTPTVNDLGAANALEALDVIRVLGPISRASLARRSQFKPAALTKLIRYLIRDGLVIETEKTRPLSTGGRPGRLLQINKSAKPLLSIDIEPDHLRVALVDLGGAVLNSRQVNYDRHQSPEATLELIRSVTESMGIGPDDIVRVGVSCAGLIDEKKGILIGSTNLPKWKDVPIRAWLKEMFKVPVNIGRSIHLAAWAEHWFRADQAPKKMLVVTLRTGIGFSLIDNGVVYRGCNQFDGELGHTLIDINGPLCECGRRGCLETFISPASITQRIRKLLAEGRAKSLAPLLDAGLEVDPELIYRMVREGDPDCTEIVTDLVRYLGIGIGNLINLLNPDQVVLCGAIEIVDESFLSQLREEICQHTLPHSWEHLEVRLAKYAERSALMGAAARATQNYIDTIIKKPGRNTSHSEV
ncbi:MAG: ROK family protein [Chthoniobacterales bacterium]